MDKRAVQEKILRKLMAMNPPKWGNSHTEEDNLLKSLPKHLRGTKVVQNAIDELYKMEFYRTYNFSNQPFLFHHL